MAHELRWSDGQQNSFCSSNAACFLGVYTWVLFFFFTTNSSNEAYDPLGIYYSKFNKGRVGSTNMGLQHCVSSSIPRLLFFSLSNLYMPTWILLLKNHNSSWISGCPSALDSALGLSPLAGFSESPVCSFWDGSSEEESAFSFCPLLSVSFVVGFSTFGFGLGILLTLAT